MKKIAKNRIDIIALLINILLFGYFGFFKEVVECGDSFQYLHQHPMREPVYSLLLQFIQWITKGNFGPLLGIVQNALAIVCVYWTYRRLCELYDMNSIIKLFVVGVLISPHIITPVASKTHLIITSTIMTEGITISLYYVWFVMLLGIICDYYKEKKLAVAYAVSFGLSALLALTRGQMALCLLVWMIVGVVKSLLGKKYKYIILFVVLAAVAFPVKSQLTKWYNLAETGNYVDTVSSKPMLMANIVYVADESDAQYIAEEDLREAFVDIVKRAKADGLTIESASGNLVQRAKHHEMSHEPLNFEYVDPAMRVVIKNREGIDEVHFFKLMIMEDALCGQMAKELLPHIAGKYFKNYFVIITLGFIRTVAIEKSILPIYALLLYICAIALLIYAFVKKGLNKYVLSMLLILVAVCGTVMGTSLVIECITRYMIYNLPFVYILGLLLLIDTFKKEK